MLRFIYVILMNLFRAPYIIPKMRKWADQEDVKNGKKYILFPEGGYEFNNRNRVCDFKAGSFKSAIKAHVPIVPIALIDSYKVFNSFYLWPITTQVHYLEPIYYEEYKDMKSKEIAELVKQRIQDKISSIL